MERYCGIVKEQLRHNLTWQTVISIAFLLFSPLILGIRNLDMVQSAKVLEMYVALIGIILFVPVFQPEQNQDLRNLISSKYFFGVLAEFLAFGGVGILAYALSDNLIIGYMAPIIYYVIAYGGGEKYLKKFYPFAMTTDYETKYVLFAVGVICMIAGIVIRGKGQR